MYYEVYNLLLALGDYYKCISLSPMRVYRYATPELGPAYMTVYPLLRTIMVAALRLLSPSHSSQMMPR